jgi:hypothetical protein
MLLALNNILPIAATIFGRAKIALFIYLELEFSRMFISASAVNHPEMAVLGIIFCDATAIIIFSLLFDDRHSGRDVNTLNTYALILHMVYAPLFFSGIDASDIHNNGIKLLNWLITARLFYFGSRDLLWRISIIEKSKKWLLNSQYLANEYINRLTVGLFFLCAAPLSVLIYLINTDKMRVTGIAIILFSFFVAIEHSAKKKLNRELLAAQKIPKSIPISEKTRVRVLRQLIRYKREALQMREWIKVLYIVGAFLLVALAAAAYSDIRRDALFGYVAGYTDAKTGKPARAPANLEKLMQCFRLRTSDHPPPPSKECTEAMQFKP